MRSVTPPPATLRRFNLGMLEPDEAERVASWIDETPGGEAAVCGTTGEDTLVSLLSTITRSDLSPDSTGVGTDSDGRGTQPERLTASSIPVRAAPPAQFGVYRVVRELGRGGMGVVHEAADERLRRKVAVKVLAPGLAAHPWRTRGSSARPVPQQR